MAGGATSARATVEGPVDSLPRLVDRLAASLLALGAGEEEQRLEALTSTSLPALRAYLDGEALLRRGAFKDANRRFRDAQALDSTFALAGVGAMRAAEWYGEDTAPARGVWAHRDRLSRRDLAWLETILGPRYPAPSSMGDYIKAAERFAQLAPDSPDAWYRLGDYLWHNGALVGLTDTWRRASAAFNRSLSLDSTYLPAIEHLGEIAAGLDDSAGARRGLALLTRFDSLSPIAQARRWNVAAILSDTAEMRKTLASDSIILDPGPWFIIIGLARPAPKPRGHPCHLPQGARPPRQRRRSGPYRGDLEPLRVDARPPRPRAPAGKQPGDGPPHLRRARRPVRRRRFGSWAGCGGRARASARPAAARGRPGPGERAVRLRPVCGGHPTCRSRAPGDRRPPDGPGRFRQPLAVGPASRLCAAARGAGGRHFTQRRCAGTPAPARLGACRSGLGALGVVWQPHRGPAARGAGRDTCSAGGGPAAGRRQWFFPHYVKYLREEGRLAALTGDRQGAIRAYRHYLALRGDAEPGLQPEVRRVREELEAVERESADR